MPRDYQKKSSYWNKFSHETAVQPQQFNFESITAGDPYYTATASLSHVARASVGRSSPDSNTAPSRANAAALTPVIDRFSAIRAGLLPFQYSRDGVSVRDAILLCQKAYFNVAIFGRTIDLMSEMSNTEIFLEGGTKKSRDFFQAWFKRIGLYKICDQYFREYFRSGNLFMYRVEGNFTSEDFAKITQVYASEGAKENKIPLNYIFLNPYDIVSKAATSFSTGDYEKILSQYDLVRLKNPQSPEDQAFFDSLPQEAKDLIAKKTWQQDGVRIKLPPEHLVFSFRKKMSYEPFAVPFGYPVLDDINAKLELKKMDQAITRTVENVILLIKTGTEPDKGGINQQNVAALQNIFKNETTGRVLVTDWTTSGEFVIPDLNKVLGSEKYKILDQDIREGLQNILLGEEKYGNTQTKVQIFLEGLREARMTFLTEFLQPEIKRVARSLGFKTFPVAKFFQADTKDPTQMWRVVTRMMELGLLTVEQGLTSIRTGEFPDPELDEFMASQDGYMAERKAGKFLPLAPVPVVSPAIDKNNLIKQPTAPSGSPMKSQKTMKSAGRPKDTKTAKASVTDIQGVVYAAESLLEFIRAETKAKYNTDSLNKNQEEVVETLCKNVVCAAEIGEWEILAKSCIDDNSKILGLNPRSEVLDAAEEHGLELYEAALLIEAQG